MREFFVGRHIEAVDPDQSRVHPLAEQLDRFAFSGALDAINQDEHWKPRLLSEAVLRLQQRFTQNGHFFVVGVLVDGVADFCGLEHRVLQEWML